MTSALNTFILIDFNVYLNTMCKIMFLKDAVRKTYKELQKQKEDFNGFKTDARLAKLAS